MNSIACICDLGFRTRPLKSSNCCIKQGIQEILETPIIQEKSKLFNFYKSKQFFSSLCQGLLKDLRDKDAFFLISFIIIAIIIIIIIIIIVVVAIIIIIITIIIITAIILLYKSNLKNQTKELGLFAPNQK